MSEDDAIDREQGEDEPLEAALRTTLVGVAADVMRAVGLLSAALQGGQSVAADVLDGHLTAAQGALVAVRSCAAARPR